MGCDIRGHISYGVKFPEGYEFAWQGEDFHDSVESWWLFIKGFKKPFVLHDENGDPVGAEWDREWKRVKNREAKKEFLDKNPVPIEWINYCGDGDGYYIVALARSYTHCCWGKPQHFDPRSLTVTKKERLELIEFIKEYCSPLNECDQMPVVEPDWLLSCERNE